LADSIRLGEGRAAEEAELLEHSAAMIAQRGEGVKWSMTGT
jgi:hypothetical protein